MSHSIYLIVSNGHRIVTTASSAEFAAKYAANELGAFAEELEVGRLGPYEPGPMGEALWNGLNSVVHQSPTLGDTSPHTEGEQ